MCKKDDLARPFPASIIRQRPGQGGRMLDYAPSWAVIERLNSVLGVGGWSWSSTHTITDTHVIATGQLLACRSSYQGEDAALIEAGRDGLANALKTASTGALVRAARLLGVGLHLYRDGAQPEAQPEAEPRPEPEPRRRRSSPGELRGTSLAALTAAAQALDWGPEELQRRSRRGWGCGYRELTTEQAAILTAELIASQEEK